MISVSLHDADRLIAINGGQFLGEFKYAARFYILLIARVRDLLEKSLGYGILFSGNIDQGANHPVGITAIRFVCYVNVAFCINPKVCNEIGILRSDEPFSASGSPENSFTVFPLAGKSLIEQKNDNTTTLPERTAEILPPPIETCLVKESCTGDTEYLAI